MSRKKILIIEDDQDMRQGLQIRLKASNYDAVFAPDAVLAVTIVRKENPDLIILDLGLPGGDGFVVMERLNNLTPYNKIPVIIVSARDPYGNQKKSIEAGALAYFQKPVDNDKLLAAIHKALGETVEES